MNEYKLYKQNLALSLKKATEAADQVEFLLSHQKTELAISRIYFQVYYSLLAYTFKKGFHFSSDTEVFNWYQNNKANLEIDDTTLQFIKEIQELNQKVLFTLSFDTKTVSFPKLTKEANQLLLLVKKWIDAPENWAHTMISAIFTILNSNAMQEFNAEQKEFAEKFMHNAKTKVCARNTKTMSICNEIMVSPSKQTLYTQLEESVNELIGKHSDLNEILEEVCFNLQILNLQNIELNVKTEDIEDQSLPEITDKETQTIIIPWDFTKVAHWALEHAVNFASITNAEIHLVHIVKKLKEAGDAEQKLKTNKAESEAKFNVRIKTAIREGTIFHAITDYATEVKAKMVIMGTHGAQGMQKFTGSWAIKVIAKTNVPFIVVQGPPVRKEIRNVIFPVDHRREIKQKVNEAYYLSQYYNLKFFITKPEKIQIDTLRQKTLNNTYFMRTFFAQHGIEHEVVEIKNAKDYNDATLKLAEQSKPDLIIIVLSKEMGIQDFMFGANEEKIIMNDAKVPVMCINPPPAKSWSYRSGTS